MVLQAPLSTLANIRYASKSTQLPTHDSPKVPSIYQQRVDISDT